MKMFTLYDTSSESYEVPMAMKTTGEIDRALSLLFQKDPDHKFVKYAKDFTLYEIGTFDVQTGETQVHPSKIHVCNLSKYIQ